VVGVTPLAGQRYSIQPKSAAAKMTTAGLMRVNVSSPKVTAAMRNLSHPTTTAWPHPNDLALNTLSPRS